MNLTRRQLLAGAPAALAQGSAARYQLGCETLPYQGHPLARALEGIRKAGYRYVMPYNTHAKERVFHAGLSASERAGLRRRFLDAGLDPFMCFVGLGAESRLPEHVDGFRAELDLAKEFGMRTVIGIGPWYFTRFPNVPKRAAEWQRECDTYYAALEQAVRHAEQIGVTITLKPHTGITSTAYACLQVVKRVPSERLKISWDAGNVSFYEGIWPDPDLPELAPHVKSVCLKDHRGLRGDANFPVPGTGQIDHAGMFKTLFAGGFSGPLAVERVDGAENAARMPADEIDRRITQARELLEPLLRQAAG